MEGGAAEQPLHLHRGAVEFVHALTDALEHHYDWLWLVQRALVLGGQIDNGACRLDRWLLTVGRLDLLSDRGVVDDLALRHEAMHAAADTLLKQARPGMVEAAIYDRFLTARKSFKEAALRLERALWSESCLVDSLTGLRNRHGMMLELHEAQQRARRERRSCIVAMMDIDHFKGINDNHGHAGGDAVLRAVTRAVARRLRPYDRIYRYGGEEFLICLPDTDLAVAKGIIERLREEIAAGPVTAAGQPIAVTASFGLATMGNDRPVEESIRHADGALYMAKQGGRNRVFVSALAGR